MHAVGAALLGFVVFVLGKVIWLLRVCLIAYFIVLSVALFHFQSQFSFLERFVSWVDVAARPLANLLRSNLPTIVAGIDIAPYLLLGIAVVLRFMIESRWARWRMKVSLWRATARRKRRSVKIRKEAHKQVGKIDTLSVAVESGDRKELL